MKLGRHSFLSHLACAATGLAVLLGSAESHASSATNVYIVELTMDAYSGAVYFRVSNTLNGTPVNLSSALACADTGTLHNKNGLTFNMNNANTGTTPVVDGKALFSLLSSAFLAGRRVVIQGMGGSCTDTSAGPFESVATVRVLGS